MGSRFECFWTEPIERARSLLRRYDPDSPCPTNRMNFCDTSVAIEDIDYPFDAGGYDFMLFGQDFPPTYEDPRWPKNCSSCGREFRGDAKWQNHVHRLFKGAPDGKLYTTRDMPPGAMYDAQWWKSHQPPPFVDGPSTIHQSSPPSGGSATTRQIPSGPFWTRTGTIPKVTARPSILTHRYHGFLTDGVLEEC